MEDTNYELITALNSVITKVFDNEESFMEECWRYGGDRMYWEELLEFYMASGSCRIAVLLPCGTTITDTVNTTDVLDWVNTL